MLQEHPLRAPTFLEPGEVERLVYADLFHEIGDVAHEYHRAFVFVERGRDHGNVAEVDVVRGFVEDEESRPEKTDPGEGHETLLTLGERADLRS